MVVLVRLPTHDHHRFYHLGVENAHIKNHHDGFPTMEGEETLGFHLGLCAQIARQSSRKAALQI